MSALDPVPFRHSLPVPDSLFDESVYLTHAGWERVEPGEAYPQAENQLYAFKYDAGRSLPEFTLCLITDGAGEVETTNKKQELAPGDAFFLVPGQWHRHRPLPDTGWTMCWIHFNGHLPHAWMKEGAYLLDGGKPVIDAPALFRAQFERLLLTAHRSPTVNSRELSWQAIGLFSHFLADPNREFEKTRHPHDEVSRLAIEYIWNHTHSEVDIAKLAYRLKISRRTLERRFKQTTGRTLHEEIQACRVERAKRLLVETNIPIKEIVFRAGFSTREHLRSAFKNQLGLPPEAYRRQAVASE